MIKEEILQLISPPGDTIQETLDEIGMSQAELAERMGRPKEKINDIIKGREPISTTTAFQLEKVLNIPASFWLSREKEYRRRLYELDQQEKNEEALGWLDHFPLREMKKLGILPDTRKKKELLDPLLRFFNIASPRQWETIYLAEEMSVAFRTSLVNTNDPYAISVWLRKGELDAGNLPLRDFDKKKFRELLAEIKELAYQSPPDFAVRLQEMCAETGVAVIYTPTLPKAPISGAVRWVRNHPLIQLSGRYRTDDHFWFTFFHEAAHILLHGKKDVFLEDVEGSSMEQNKEEEANGYAARILLKESELREILAGEELTEEVILDYARKFRTPPGVIIGRLQHEGIIDYSAGNHLRRKINLFDETGRLVTN